MARVDTGELVRQTKLSKPIVEKVVSQIIANKDNHKRQPKAPAPEGGISIREASRKYKIATSTIAGWVDQKRITVLDKTPNWTYLKEADIIPLAEIHKDNRGKGKKAIKKHFG